MARLYADENFALGVVEELRRLGHDVVTSQEAGNANIGVPDQSVLQFAVANRRAVLTYNRCDFLRLHRRTPNHCGIIVCSVDDDFLALATRIDLAIQSVPDLSGILLRVNLPG